MAFLDQFCQRPPRAERFIIWMGKDS